VSHITASIRDFASARAENRCEYCQLSQEGQEAAFHIDHIVPRAAGGATVSENLALACVSCSLHKWAKQSALDLESGEEVPLFNPRSDRWADHFRWDGPVLIPMTATGRATAATLDLNRPLILAIRREEAERGRFPK
jgi:hypothetical protein